MKNELEAGGHRPPEEPWLDLRRYLHILLKRKWLILAVLVVTVGGVSVWTFTRVRIYQATASVLVQERAPQVLGSEVRDVVDLSMGGYYRAKEHMETQRKVITSNAMAVKVADELKLVQNDTFWGPRASTKETGVRVAPSTADAAGALQRMVDAQIIRDTNIIEISVRHTDPKLAARLANAVAQAFMDQNVEYKLSSTTGAVKWLSDQLDDLKKQLEQAETALYEFKKKHNIVSLSLEDRQSTLARQMVKITDAVTEIRMRRMAIDAQRKQIVLAREKTGSREPLKLAVAPVLDNGVVQKLKEVYLEHQRRLLALRERYLDRHPVILEQQAKVDAARRDLEQEVSNVIAALESKYAEARDHEGQLARALQSTKDEALDLNKREVAYQRLKRTQENTAKLYSMVLTRMTESDLTGQVRVNNIRLLDAAAPPKAPVRPRVQLNLLIGTVLGLILGIGLALLVDTLDSSVKSQEDVGLVPGLVFFGLMPKIPGNATSHNGRRHEPRPELDLIVHRNPKSSVAESCRAIRTNILFASTDRAVKTIVVTSPGPKEGKTTTAVSLAITMAQAGSRTLIVDTDMRRPRIHGIFSISGSEGITSILLGDVEIDKVIKPTEVPGLFALPCGPVPPNPAEICQGERFKALLAELSNRFDHVILDSPPVMIVTDAVILSTLVSGTLLVARTGQTTRPGLIETARALRDVGGNLLGCVLNDMDLERLGYQYYRYRRYGYYRYGYYKRGYSHYGEGDDHPAEST